MSKKRKKPAASKPPLYKFRIDDAWKPRGNKAKGDNCALSLMLAAS